MADWTITQGDTAPVFEDTLTYADGTLPALAGATLALVMRALTADEPLELTGTATILSTVTNAVRYAPSDDDTAEPGQYMAAWKVTFAGGQTMTFPTIGYITVEVTENLLTTGGAQLVSLPDVKRYLDIADGERDHDAQLLAFVEAARPIVENITGPIISTVFAEEHAGGGAIIQIRRSPSAGYATSPVLTLLTATEYLGSQARALTVVSAPNLGTAYSCTIDSLGTITRRTGGGGRGVFADPVRITYRAGQSAVPPNVREGTLELIRVNYQPTRARGSGRRTVADEQDTGAPLGFFVPRRVAEILAPNRRAPSVA